MLGDLLVRIDERAMPPVARLLYRLVGGPLAGRAFTAAGMAGVVAATLLAVWAVHRDHPAGAAGPPVVVGPAPGQPLLEYARSGRAELAALLRDGGTGADVYALVAFTAYLAPERLTPIVGGASVPWTFLRARLAHVTTSPVRVASYRIPGDVTAAMDDVAERRDRQAEQAQRAMDLIPDDTVEHRQERARYRAEAVAAATEATAYRQHCSCVYAAVVQARPTDLQEIAQRPEVRVVDPAPTVRRLDRAVFHPPLPEQVTGAQVPDDRDLDPGSAEARPLPLASPAPTATRPNPSRTVPGGPGSTTRTIPVRPAPTCTRTPGRSSPSR